MSAPRKTFRMVIEVTGPAWLGAAAARREVRAVLQGYPGYSSIHGDNTLDHIGQGNGLRVRKVSGA